VCYEWGDSLLEGEGRKPLIRVCDWDGFRGLVRVDAIGAGTLFVRRRVFDRIRDELGEAPFATSARWQGEDIAFFDRLRRLGIPAWLDTRIETGHLAWTAIDSTNWKANAAAVRPYAQESAAWAIREERE
jgi:hypothetical protein